MRRRPCRLRDNRILRRPLGPHNTFAERVAPTGHTRRAAGLPGWTDTAFTTRSKAAGRRSCWSTAPPDRLKTTVRRPPLSWQTSSRSSPSIGPGMATVNGRPPAAARRWSRLGSSIGSSNRSPIECCGCRTFLERRACPRVRPGIPRWNEGNRPSAGHSLSRAGHGHRSASPLQGTGGRTPGRAHDHAAAGKIRHSPHSGARVRARPGAVRRSGYLENTASIGSGRLLESCLATGILRLR